MAQSHTWHSQHVPELRQWTMRTSRQSQRAASSCRAIKHGMQPNLSSASHLIAAICYGLSAKNCASIDIVCHTVMGQCMYADLLQASSTVQQYTKVSIARANSFAES
eukprot:588712-Pelagomonas_calceolata.AAC.1